jgi:RHS repeat-associated protein
MVGDALGTSSAYWTTWTVDPIGWRSQVQHSTTGGTDTTTNYAYTATGQPHTLTSATSTGGTPGGSTYTYDTAGNMITRNAGQGNQTLTWDDNRQLAAINGSTGGNTTFLYDADGELLLQKDPGTTTLYLGGQQHTLTTATGVITGTRYYKLPGGGTAIRTGTADTAITFAIGDQHGTPTLYLDYTGQTPAWRQYTPYGAPRGTVITTVDNHGFLDKPLNATTGLTQVGARNYDPQTGRFISLDPILETTDPQQLNGYGYGANNPNTQADPSGLMLPNDPNGSSSAGNPTPNPQPWGDGRPVEPQCLTVKISGSCTASGSFLRQANIANHSTQNGIDRAESQGGSCVPYAMQVVCFNSEGFLADGHPQTVGDVLLFPGSRSDFELLLKGEEKTRSDIANRCDKQGHCLDPNVFGPDLLGHEAAHSDQWTHYSGLVDFGAAYAIEQANSSHICGEYGVCNKFEVNANPFKGGYWKAPTVSNGSFVVAPGSTEHAKRFMCQNWSVPGWNASHWYTTSMCL